MEGSVVLIGVGMLLNYLDVAVASVITIMDKSRKDQGGGGYENCDLFCHFFCVPFRHSPLLGTEVAKV